MRGTDEQEAQEGLAELVREFDSALLVFPATTGALEARPMIVARDLSRADLWFMALISPAKADEIAKASEVLVTMRRGQHWLAVNGTLEFHHCASPGARADIAAAAFASSWRLCLHDSRYPDLTLARLVPTIAEYWDNSGTGALYVAIRGARAAFDDPR
jgi:general stress protein 26